MSCLKCAWRKKQAMLQYVNIVDRGLAVIILMSSYKTVFECNISIMFRIVMLQNTHSISQF